MTLLDYNLTRSKNRTIYRRAFKQRRKEPSYPKPKPKTKDQKPSTLDFQVALLLEGVNDIKDVPSLPSLAPLHLVGGEVPLLLLMPASCVLVLPLPD